MNLLCFFIWATAGFAQYVPEPYGWSCYRMAGKRSWPQCATLSGAKQRSCLCGIPEFVELTEACLQRAVANATDPEESILLARELSLCPAQKQSLTSIKKPITPGALKSMPEYEIIDPISAEEIEIAISTADWRMTNDHRAERAGATLVAFWGFVVLVRYLAHLLGKCLTQGWFTKLVLWKPVRLVRSFIVNAPLGKRQHSEPWLKKLGIRLPTRSISIVIFLFTALNYALVFSDFPYTENNFIYTTRTQQWNKTLAIRCAFVIMWKLPLVFCFAGRNNIFLLLGHPWSLDTFNTFHRWIARLTIVDIIIHGIAISLVKAEQHIYGYVWSVKYWIWGIVGVFIATIILVQSMHWISRIHYEVFKVLHTVLAIVFVIATWYHVKVLPYGLSHTYAVIAIWSFDNLCRIIRLISANRVKAQLSHHTEDVMTLTFEAPKSFSLSIKSQSAFLYLHLPPYYCYWQSHPFTIMKPLALCASKGSQDGCQKECPNDYTMPSISKQETQITDISSMIGANSEGFNYMDLEKLTTGDDQSFMSNGGSVLKGATTGKGNELVIGIKAQKGITRKLAKMDDGLINIAVDGPYGTFFPLERFRHIICIAGGIGISAHMSYIQYLLEHAKGRSMQINLYWAVSNIHEYEWMIDVLKHWSSRVQVKIYIGNNERAKNNEIENTGLSKQSTIDLDSEIIEHSRLNTMDVVKAEVAAINNNDKPASQKSTAIFACGPDRLNDDTRLAACWAIMHADAFVDYFEDAFNW